MAAKIYCYNGHDARPNPGRAGPAERQRRMAELDDLMIMVAQVQRRLSRGHQIQTLRGLDLNRQSNLLTVAR